MDKAQITQAIGAALKRIAADRGEPSVEFTGATLLFGDELSIDSLDLATVVVELQSLTGKDPFEAGFIEFQTVDELASLFAE